MVLTRCQHSNVCQLIDEFHLNILYWLKVQNETVIIKGLMSESFLVFMHASAYNKCMLVLLSL